jgi:glycine/sarcosine N-methyltransferase
MAMERHSPRTVAHVDPADFYDDLAEVYHLIFADWDASIARQSGVLDALLREHRPPVRRVLDATCGIGTQALGMAHAGYEVTASDVSVAAVQRCAREAAARGLRIATAVADVRELDLGRFDAVVSFDNSLPHLLTDADLGAACAALHESLEPGGLLLASTRDYDAEPTGDPPRDFGDRVVEQIWEPRDADLYTLRHRISSGDGTVTERRTTYRALRRATLTTALEAAGFEDVRWRMPEETGFYQPVVSARTSSRATATGRTRR